MHALAREEHDPIKVKVFRFLGQVAAIPHVKRHGLEQARKNELKAFYEMTQKTHKT
jgi:hypothetical protein